jgi:hypothetical protein
VNKVLKLMPDYHCFPIWKAEGDFGNVDPDELPVADGLKAAFRDWAATYDRTLNQEYPPDSAFASAAEREAFETEGRRLWRALQEQLGPDYKVMYFSVQDNRLYE